MAYGDTLRMPWEPWRPHVHPMENGITMEKSSRLEDGCNDFTFSVELNDPRILRITECWDNMEALEAHFSSPHMAEFRKSLATLPAEGRDVHFYEVIQEVRRP